jgi:hypothetical protein
VRAPWSRDVWRRLEAELDRWGDAGRAATFWWRDDDASDATPALETLLGSWGIAFARLWTLSAGAWKRWPELRGSTSRIIAIQPGGCASPVSNGPLLPLRP